MKPISIDDQDWRIFLFPYNKTGLESGERKRGECAGHITSNGITLLIAVFPLLFCLMISSSYAHLFLKPFLLVNDVRDMIIRKKGLHLPFTYFGILHSVRGKCSEHTHDKNQEVGSRVSQAKRKKGTESATGGVEQNNNNNNTNSLTGSHSTHKLTLFLITCECSTGKPAEHFYGEDDIFAT